MKSIIDILIKGFEDDHEQHYIETVFRMIKKETGLSDKKILEKAIEYCGVKGKTVTDMDQLEWCFVDLDIHEFGDVSPIKRAGSLLTFIR